MARGKRLTVVVTPNGLVEGGKLGGVQSSVLLVAYLIRLRRAGKSPSKLVAMPLIPNRGRESQVKTKIVGWAHNILSDGTQQRIEYFGRGLVWLVEISIELLRIDWIGVLV